MGFRLPVITTNTNEHPAVWGECIGIDPNSEPRFKFLLDLESSAAPRTGGDRCIPLGKSHWCIGRTKLGTCIWRILPRQALAQVHHPAWLWIEDGWFEALDRTRGPRPEMRTLANQLQHAQTLEARPDQNHRLLANAVAHIRKQKGPLAIVLNAEQLSSPGQPVRWLALALLTCLPPKLRARLRISTAEVDPDPQHWDVVFTETPPKGFQSLQYGSAKSHGSDPVASFIHNSLQNGHPDRIEAFAFMSFGEGPDPWGAAALRLKEPEHWSTRDITPTLVRDHPEQALGHLLFLFAWGKTVHVPFARRLTAYTMRTGDPTPWQPLMARSIKERTLAVQHYLEQPKKSRPSASLLFSIAMTRPRGTLIDLWCRSLMEWSEHPTLAEVAEDLLLGVLYKDPMPQEPSSRATLWTLLLRRILQQCRFDEARRLFHHPATQRLLHQDIARVIAIGWLALPASHKDINELIQLVTRMTESRDGDKASLLLASTLDRENHKELATAVVQQWARVKAREPLREKDALLQWVKDTPYARDWAGEVARYAPSGQAATWIQPITTGPQDSLWTFAEASRSKALDLAPHKRLHASLAFFPQGGQAMEQAMRRLLTNLSFERLPDSDTAQVATTYSGQIGSGSIWLLLAAVAASDSDPSQNHTAVSQIAKQPPQTKAEQTVAKKLALALGRQSARLPEEQSNWLHLILSRYTTSPSDFMLELAQSLAIGLSQQDTDGTVLARVTNHLLQDPSSAPSVAPFLQHVLQGVWPSGVPATYVQTVQQDPMSDETLTLWTSHVFASSDPT